MVVVNGWHRERHANTRVFDVGVELQQVPTDSQGVSPSPFADPAGSSVERATPLGHRELPDGNDATHLRPPMPQATPGAAASRWRASAQKIVQMNKSTSSFAKVSQHAVSAFASFAQSGTSDIAEQATWGRAGSRPKTPVS